MYSFIFPPPSHLLKYFYVTLRYYFAIICYFIKSISLPQEIFNTVLVNQRAILYSLHSFLSLPFLTSQSPTKSTRRAAMAPVWRTFHHDGKISPAWWGWGVHAHALSFTISIPSRTKLWCTLKRKGRRKSNINVWFPFMFSQKWNCYFQNRIIMFSLPVPSLTYLWEIFIFPCAVCILCCREICGLILGIYKLLTDTWMWKLGLRLRYSQKRNT